MMVLWSAELISDFQSKSYAVSVSQKLQKEPNIIWYLT